VRHFIFFVLIYGMPKSSAHLEWLPAPAVNALRELGGLLAVARVRRKESLRAWAARLGVSVRTVQRLENGDPGVGMGVYAAALWLIGRAEALPGLADPSQDRGALELDVRQARERLARRPKPGSMA
jgi:transcriptional regulator with XRE-family HTH domain